MPLNGTFRNDAISLALVSNSLIFIGFDCCIIGRSFFPLIQTKTFCLVSKSSVFISTLMAS